MRRRPLPLKAVSVPDVRTAPGADPETRRVLPRLILIADRFTDPSVAHHVLAAVRAGVPWVHLRDHAAGEDVFLTAARAITDAIRRDAPHVLISINGRLDVARELGTGFHTGVHGPSIPDARNALHESDGPVGYSAHGAREARLALEAGADYLFFSPVYPTTSKPGQPARGLDGLRGVTQDVEKPVYALGGITPERVRGCMDAGAYGVAVLGGILKADDPALAVQAYLAACFD